MQKITRVHFLILIIFLTGIWILLAKFRDFRPHKYQIIKFIVPKDENKNGVYTSFFLLNKIKDKKRIQIELDEDCFANLKKIDLIRYEARKLKYTKDTSSVVDIGITNEVTYGEFLQLIKICQQDNHKIFALVKNRFFIFGDYPPVPKDTSHIITPIYL